ncbi:hypothetical protein K492DRAFT_207714 [Lichtheimia hyalospora FSU 10163]|nr:hypothetical protein K492DRAFT_207714 [Lichtheimia hyalospora FSU 10163]
MIASAKSSKRPLSNESFERVPPGKFPKTFHTNGKPESNRDMDNSCQRHDDREQALQVTPVTSNAPLDGISLVNKLREKRQELKRIYITLLKRMTEQVTVDEYGRLCAQSTKRWKSIVSIPGFEKLPDNDQIAWQLCTLLFDPQPNNEQRLRHFRDWLLNYVSIRADTAAEYATLHHHGDPYAPIFTYLTCGSLQGAVRATIQGPTQDNELAHMIASSPAPFKELYAMHKKRLDELEQSGQFDTFTPYQRRIWRVLCGDMTILDDDLDWRQAFVLYIMYGQIPNHENNKDVDRLDALIGLYIDYFEEPCYHRMSHELNETNSQGRPTWYTVLKFWRRQHYHPEQLHLDRHPIHLDDWSPWLGVCFSIFFPTVFPRRKVAEWIQRVSQQLQQVGATNQDIPSILAPYIELS